MTAHKREPFYVQLSHYAVHSPTEASAESSAAFEKERTGTRHSDSEYAAMTYDFDRSVGRLLDAMDELGLAENTYVIFMSDNGAPAGPRKGSQNLPLNGGKGTFYEGGIRVPLIIRGPDIDPNSHCAERVIGYDLFPTFCELAGTRAGDIEGISLVPLLKGEPQAFVRSRPLLFHYPHYGKGPHQKPQSAMISGSYKLLRDMESGALQLFDLGKDLSEKTDLSKKLPEKTAELVRLMDQRLRALGAQMPENNPDYKLDSVPLRFRRGNR